MKPGLALNLDSSVIQDNLPVPIAPGRPLQRKTSLKGQWHLPDASGAAKATRTAGARQPRGVMLGRVVPPCGGDAGGGGDQ